MPFIKAQKVIYDENGKISSGSAAIVDTYYGDFGTYHAKHTVREKLGKVLWLSDDKRRGIFMSSTRGLVEYNADTDVFSPVDRNDDRLMGTETFPETRIHTVFGDSYMLLKFLENEGLMKILRDVFQTNPDYERLLCHIIHGVLKDGSKITCDNFLMKSFASYLFPDVPLSSLKSDTRFFTMMGDDKTKLQFFKKFVDAMREKLPSFGKGCYVDSTPLPNDIDDNPFNALSSHGIGSCGTMERLVLVLDEETGLPVWYDIIPGNVIDLNTTMNVVNDTVDSLGVIIHSLVLDAGYVSKELIGAFHNGTEKSFIGRMPAKKGFPFKELYHDVKNLIGKGKYSFVRNNHVYFGHKKEIELFGQKLYAHIYVDHPNALKGFKDYIAKHDDEFEKMANKDKDWIMVKGGFFILLSNIDSTPEDILSRYFGRTNIETVFKTSKEYLDLLPLSKWTDETVRGKILSDIINTIVLLLLRKKMGGSGLSASELYGKSQSLMCFRNNKGMVTVETPCKQVKECYKLLGLEVPAHVNVESFKKKNLLLK